MKKIMFCIFTGYVALFFAAFSLAEDKSASKSPEEIEKEKTEEISAMFGTADEFLNNGEYNKAEELYREVNKKIKIEKARQEKEAKRRELEMLKRQKDIERAKKEAERQKKLNELKEKRESVKIEREEERRRHKMKKQKEKALAEREKVLRAKFRETSAIKIR